MNQAEALNMAADVLNGEGGRYSREELTEAVSYLRGMQYGLEEAAGMMILDDELAGR